MKMSPIGDGEFTDYDIITPLRALLLKTVNPQQYQALHELESNMEQKVNNNFIRQKMCLSMEYMTYYLLIGW